MEIKKYSNNLTNTEMKITLGRKWVLIKKK